MTKKIDNAGGRLGTWNLTVFYISSIVGVGILIVPGIAYQLAGPASLISWLLLIVVSFPLAYIFSRISMKHPNNGGIVYFIRLRFGGRIGHASGLLLALTMVVGNPIMGIASARYLLHMFDVDVSSGNVIAAGFGFMCLSVLFNMLNIRVNGRVQMGLLILLLTGLISVLVIAAPHYNTASLVPFTPNGWASIGTAMVVCLYSFLGWENVSTIAEEVRDPERTYRRAMVISVITVGLLYLAVAAAIALTVPYDGAIAEELVMARLLSLNGSTQTLLFGNVVALVMIVLCTNAWVLGASRFIASLGRDGILPSLLCKVSKRTAVPYYSLFALLLSYGVVLLLLFISGGDEKQLMLFANSSFIVVYALAFMASFKYFKDNKYVNGFVVFSLLFCAFSLYFIGWIAVLPVIFLLFCWGKGLGNSKIY